MPVSLNISKKRVSQMAKRLAVFDFDHTIVEDNTDIVARKLIDEKLISPDVRTLYRSDGWTQYMQEIFKLLRTHGITSGMVKEAISKQVEVHGMTELITALKEHGFDVIILSDSNSLFIEWWLERQCLRHLIHAVFTNPARVDNDQIELGMYHLQTECQLSSKNLCKGRVLDEFLEKQATNGVVYSSILYAGDGKNDLCPILRLKSNDLACVRKGFALEQTVINDNILIKAEVLFWNDAFDILQKMKKN